MTIHSRSHVLISYSIYLIIYSFFSLSLHQSLTLTNLKLSLSLSLSLSLCELKKNRILSPSTPQTHNPKSQSKTNHNHLQTHHYWRKKKNRTPSPPQTHNPPPLKPTLSPTIKCNPPPPTITCNQQLGKKNAQTLLHAISLPIDPQWWPITTARTERERDMRETMKEKKEER